MKTGNFIRENGTERVQIIKDWDKDSYSIYYLIIGNNKILYQGSLNGAYIFGEFSVIFNGDVLYLSEGVDDPSINSPKYIREG